jgi:hypothetical protein
VCWQALTTPSGMRVAPGKEDLAQLCEKAKTLDMPLLLMLFCSKLEDAGVAWQARLRTLYCLEALAKCPDQQLRAESLKLLQGRVALVEASSHAPEKALAEMGRKVAALIRAAAPGSCAPAAAPAPATSSAGAAGGDSLATLFDGLSVSGGAARAAAGGGGSVGGDLDSLLTFDAPGPRSGVPTTAPMDLLSQVRSRVTD